MKRFVEEVDTAAGADRLIIHGTSEEELLPRISQSHSTIR